MKISFIIPFHNEEENAGSMIEAVAKYATSQKWDFEIIPVNDRSTDATAQILKTKTKKYKFVHPVERKWDGSNTGNTMGLALLEGSHKAQGELIIWTMGDRSDDVHTYSAIIKKIGEGYDLVFGSRYMPGGTWGSLDPTKAFLSSRGTILARFLFGLPVHDVTNAFRGFRRGMLEKLQLHSSGFAISPEMAIKAHLAGFRLGEVPTVYNIRTAGVSSFKLWEMSVEYLKMYARLYLLRLLGITSPHKK